VKLYLSWQRLELSLDPKGVLSRSIQTPVPSLVYSLFLYLSSLRVFQSLGTVHIQKEVLQQGLCFLQVLSILWLELKGLILLMIAGILETREDREKKPGGTTQTFQHSPWPMQRTWMLNTLTTEEHSCNVAAGERMPSQAAHFSISPTQGTSVGQAGCLPLGLLGGTGLCCCR